VRDAIQVAQADLAEPTGSAARYGQRSKGVGGADSAAVDVGLQTVACGVVAVHLPAAENRVAGSSRRTNAGLARSIAAIGRLHAPLAERARHARSSAVDVRLVPVLYAVDACRQVA